MNVIKIATPKQLEELGKLAAEISSTGSEIRIEDTNLDKSRVIALVAKSASRERTWLIGPTGRVNEL